ncbi:calbindin-32-like [Symsagittifera roscoffensis]|uniref:calbindin-32-like n=1 Tax=Symsagittifera roscoffensis TaxID=84072 RepID=UPI00307B3A11
MAGEKEKAAIKSLLEDETAMKCIVDNIMTEFDKDKNGQLDKEETKLLIKHFLSQSELCDEGDLQIPDELYNNIFQAYDSDGSGAIDKDELAGFIKQLLGELLSGEESA